MFRFVVDESDLQTSRSHLWDGTGNTEYFRCGKLIREALRVLKKGGNFAFQDLFNEEFYGNIDALLENIREWGLKEVNLVVSSDYIYVPVALRLRHIVGGSKILFGIK